MFQSWVKWCINHDLKFIVYIVWLIILPVFLLVYLKDARNDALQELEYIKNAKKGEL
jgi:hypothetical protein